MSSGMFRYLISFCGVVFFLFMACVRPSTVISPPALPKATKEKIIAALKKNSLNFSSLKSLVKIKVEYPEGRKVKKQSFDGALLCRGSGAFRLQAFGFFGRTLFDLLYKSNEITLYIPSSSTAYQGIPYRLMSFNETDIFSIIRKGLINMGENYDEATFHFQEDVYSPWIGNGKQNYFLLKVNPRTLLVDKKIIFQSGKTVAEITYQKYRKFEDELFPTRIKIYFSAQQTTIEFLFDSVVVNEELSDNLFILSLPADIKRLPLSKLPSGLLINPAS